MPDSLIRFGATPLSSGTEFALWSTRTRSAAVRLFDARGNALATEPLDGQSDGVFRAIIPNVGVGAFYKFVLDGEEVGDIYARFLPNGVFGPARVEAPGKPLGKPLARSGMPRSIYELHVGTFTREGTYRAAQERLEHIADLGVDALELMPLSAFPGRCGWGYDGVSHYAPFAPYGEPNELRQFIARAHELGLGVLLDVVYNHFGPAGNWLPRYAPEYFDESEHTPWGPALNFRHPMTRRYVLDNARYWIEEFGFDGLRLDATHAIIDHSPEPILHELARVAASYDPPRVLVAEDERNDADLVLRDGINAVWADDFHHAVRVNLTAERDGYYAAYPTNVETIAETINRGWYYDGRVYPLTHVPRGTPATELAFSSLVYCIQNHDQVGNRAFGTRLNQEVSDEAYRAAVMLLLFLPTTSLLFMGQEWAASTPFLFFTDHGKELGELISRGRREEFKRFAAFADPEQRKKIPDPQAPNTFENSRLDWEELKRPEKQRVLELHRRLLELRRQDPVLGAECARGELSASARGSLLGVLRARGDEARLLLVNFGEDPRSLPAHGARALLSTSDEPLRALERYGAVILAGAARELRGIIDSV